MNILKWSKKGIKKPFFFSLQANRWRKKGMSIVPMSWLLHLTGPYNILISIYQGDGTVAVSHGGIEIGQGIDTKV